MSLDHVQKCRIAAKDTIKNRISIVKKAYNNKEGRTSASLGALKTATILIGYGAYALIPEKLRTYTIFDDVD